MLASASASGQNVAAMYDAPTIARAKPRLESRVREIYAKAFAPHLTAEERRALSQVRIQSPVEGDPVLGYYSDSRTRTVTMPAISLLFFEDLCVAYAWLQQRGYRLETIEEYVSMLKYARPQQFGRGYLPPLEALGIPEGALDDPRVNDLSLRFRNTGYAFILGHELGHILYQDRGYAAVPPAISQTRETRADDFALELMRRVYEIPMGALLFFQTAVFYFENRADFRSDAEWQAQVSTGATHPLSTDRLERLSKSVAARAADFSRTQSDRIAAIGTMRLIGDGFARFASYLSDPVLQRAMRQQAERSTAASLKPRR
jgi:hypothetical protein